MDKANLMRPMTSNCHSVQSISFLNFFAGSKFRQRDHYKARKMSLWLNLIPDLQSAVKATTTSNSDISDYRLYSELLPFVPKLKYLANDLRELGDASSPASSEVLWPNRQQHHNQSQQQQAESDSAVNSTYFLGGNTQ